MQYLRQNSGTGAASGVTISIGPALDSVGAEYTGLVIGDLTLVKNGTSAVMAANSTLTHVSNGHYDLVTIGNNADTLGRLDIRCNKAAYQIPPREFMVLPVTVYDAIVANAAGGANGLLLSLASNQVDVGKIAANSNAATTAGRYWGNVVTGTAQAGAAGTITLASGESAVDDFYNGAVIFLTGGTGIGQYRKITDYVGSTKVATIDSNWVTNPTSSTVYIITGRIT